MTIKRDIRRPPANPEVARAGPTALAASMLTVALLAALCNAPRCLDPGPRRSGWLTAETPRQRLTLLASQSAERPGQRHLTRPGIWASLSGTAAAAGVVDVVSDISDGNGLAGTAIVIGDGYLVTAAHLIRGFARAGDDETRGRLWVSDPGGLWTHPAWVVGTDDRTDLAVLWAPEPALQPAVIGDSRTVREGDVLTVIGNPGGLGPLHVATGAVLDLHAVIATTNPAIGPDERDAAPTSLTTMIEIQADVVAGDSGGAVLNSQGQVVAMILAYVPGAGPDSVRGRGYAMPIDRVTRAADRLVPPGTRRCFHWPTR